MMMASVADSREVEANKANLHRFVDEALNRGILDVVDQTRGEFAGQSKARIRAWRQAFPDFHTAIENLVAEDDWVAFQLRHHHARVLEELRLVP
jgi:predicted ester cyclase